MYSSYQKEKELEMQKEREKYMLHGIGVPMEQSERKLTKEQSIGMGNFLEKTRVITKQKAKMLQQLLQKEKKKAIGYLRKLSFGKGLSNKLVKLLFKVKMKSKDRGLILKFIKSLLKGMLKNIDRDISLSGIMHLWHSLPNDLKQFIIALIVLRAEVIHQMRLRLEKDKRRIIQINRYRPPNSLINRRGNPYKEDQYERKFMTNDDVLLSRVNYKKKSSEHSNNNKKEKNRDAKTYNRNHYHSENKQRDAGGN